MPKNYRIAIIGVGAIANMHARAIGDIPNATLVAGSCRNEDKGRKFANQYNCTWYDNYERMLDVEKPDIATICTPSGLHLEPTLACAKRGIHVICEKPLEITTARVDQMIAAAQEAKILLGGIFPQRYNPVVRALRDTAAAGRFGALATVSSIVPWWRDDAYYAPTRWQGKLAMDGGGAMMNQSIHGVDAVQWIVGAAIRDLPAGANPVEEVFCYTAKRGHDPKLIEIEDTAVAVLRFRDGSLGQLLCATSMFPGSFKRLQIGGRDGTAEVLEDELTTFQFRHEHPDDAAIRQRFGKQTQHGGGASDPMAINYGLHTGNIADFLQALEQGKQPGISGPEARKAVAIVEACYRSAQSGTPQTVK